MDLEQIKEWIKDNSVKIIVSTIVIILFILLCFSLPSKEELESMAKEAKARYEEMENNKVDRWRNMYCKGLTEEECSELIIEFKKEEFKERTYGHPMTATEYWILK